MVGRLKDTLPRVRYFCSANAEKEYERTKTTCSFNTIGQYTTTYQICKSMKESNRISIIPENNTQTNLSNHLNPHPSLYLFHSTTKVATCPWYIFIDHIIVCFGNNKITQLYLSPSSWARFNQNRVEKTQGHRCNCTKATIWSRKNSSKSTQNTKTCRQL